jgi:hypothetical protein
MQHVVVYSIGQNGAGLGPRELRKSGERRNDHDRAMMNANVGGDDTRQRPLRQAARHASRNPDL